MTAKRLLIGPVVETMRWMTRYMGWIARPVIRWVADREVIACGLLAPDSSVRIIYSPQTGRSDYRIVCRSSDGWIPAVSNETEDFAPGLVKQVIIPDAKISDRYRVLAVDPNGRTISSPVIRVKHETRLSSDLVVEFDQTDGARICWPRTDHSAAMLYFLTVQKLGDPTSIGIYTRERSWHYPTVSTASLTIGQSDPPPLVTGAEYRLQVVVVDYDGWVPTSLSWNGTA